MPVGDGIECAWVQADAQTAPLDLQWGRANLLPQTARDTECVVIEPDGEERWIEHAPFDLHTASREASLAWLRDCGIVGLGGAGTAFERDGALAWTILPTRVLLHRVDRPSERSSLPS